MTVVQDHREYGQGGRFVEVPDGHRWWYYRDSGVELVEGPW